jgi:hypothetical protein
LSSMVRDAKSEIRRHDFLGARPVNVADDSVSRAITGIEASLETARLKLVLYAYAGISPRATALQRSRASAKQRRYLRWRRDQRTGGVGRACFASPDKRWREARGDE